MIYNLYGTILNNKTIILLNNQTIYLKENGTIELYGKVMAGNYTIISPKNIIFKVNGTEINGTLEKDHYIANYTIALNIGDELIVNGTYDTTNLVSYKTSLIIMGLPVNITVDNITIPYNQNIIVNVNVTSNGTAVDEGIVYIMINETQYAGIVSDGKASINLPKMEVNVYSLMVMHPLSEKYVRANTTFILNVLKINTTLNITTYDVAYGDDAVIVVNVNPDATGSVNININGTDYPAEIKNGHANITVSNLCLGNYTVNVTYLGDNNFYKASNTSNFTVSKGNIELNIEADDIAYGDDAVIVVNVNPKATGNITIELAGKNYTKQIENGKVVFVISGLALGQYDIIASYSGDANFQNTTKTVSFKVLSSGDSNGSSGNADNTKSKVNNSLKTGNSMLVLEVLLAILTIFTLRRKD